MWGWAVVRITFDSNVWERIVVPNCFPNDPSASSITTIRAAISSGAASGFISETVATLEAIKKVKRPDYFSESTEKITFDERPSEGATISGSVCIRADDEMHYGIMPILRDRLSLAISEFGFKLLRVPRIGVARPTEILDASLTADVVGDIWDHLDRFSEVCQTIEATARGFACIESLAADIEKRIGSRSEFMWRDYLKFANDTEKYRIAPAIAEWADGDSVASHFAYGNDIFCTCDRAVEAGFSVFDLESRAALQSGYNICFMNLEELAAHLERVN